MATLEYRRVIDAGPGWTRVELSDGRVVTMRGDRAMRNNNPGNIEYGPFTRGAGALGTDNRFAVFPSRQTGTRAQAELIFNSRVYRDLTLRQAIAKYAPAFENNTARYQNAVANAAGVSLDTRMRDIPASKRSAVLQGMHAVEGNTSARGYDQAGNHLFTTDAVSPPTPNRGPAVPRSASGYLDLPRSMGPSGVLGLGGKAPEQTYAAPVGKVERKPLGPASLPPDRPMPSGPLAGAPQPEFVRPMPTGPVKPSVPKIDPKVLAAYQEYAQLRGLAPAVPAPTAVMRPPDPLLNAPMPAAPPPPAPVYQPPVPQAPPMDFPSAPPAPPPSRPMDVYNGLASSAQDAMGNTVFSDPRGIGITNKFGATTYSPDGLTTAAGGNFGGLGIGSAFEPDPTLGGRSPAGNMARQGVGGLGGAAVGGLLGPVGSLLGGLIGRELAKPGGGKIGDFVNGVRTVNGMQFARPQGGLAFPNAPSGGPRDPRFSNRSDREMREISPRAARDISRGKGGLY